MAVVWGSGAGAGFGIFYAGIDVSVSGTTVTCRYYVKTDANSVDDTQTATFAGSVTGTQNYSMTTPNGAAQLIATKAFSAARGTSGSVKLTLSGLFSSSTARPTVTVGWAVPALVPSASSAPTVSAITASSAKLAWTSTSTQGNGAPITAWQLQVSTSSGFGSPVYDSSSASTPQTVSGLSGQTTYYARVRGRNSVGWGAWSSARSFTTAPAAPSAPTGVTVSRTADTSHTVSWTRAASATAPYTSQLVQRLDIATGVWSTVATLGGASTTGGQSWTDTGTSANRSYRWRVAGVNASGTATSSQSAVVYTTPATPANLAAEKIASAIRLLWSNRSTYTCQVQVWHAADGVWDGSPLATLAAGASPTYTHASPNPAQTHQYRVRAVQGSLVSGYTTSGVVQLDAPPNAPTPTATPGWVDAHAPVTVRWRHNPVDMAAQTKYALRWRYAGSSTWTTLATVTSSTPAHTFAVDTFTPDVTVEWQAQTWGVHPTASPWSATAVVRTSEPPQATIMMPGDVISSPVVAAEVAYYQAAGVLPAGWQTELVDSDGATVETRSGSATEDTAVVYPPWFTTTIPDGSSWTMRARMQSGAGMWSEWAEQPFTADYPEPIPPTVGAVWNRDGGSVDVVIENPAGESGEPDVVSNDVYRSTDGGATWVQIATGVTPNGVLTDPIPPLNRPSRYRVVAWSDVPSSMSSDSDDITPDEPGWLWVNYGPGWATTVRMYGNLALSGKVSRARALHAFAGRPRRVAFIGDATTLTLTVDGRLTPDASSLTEWETAALESDVVCIRDPKGRRVFGIIPELSHSWQTPTLVGISFTVEEVDHDE